MENQQVISEQIQEEDFREIQKELTETPKDTLIATQKRNFKRMDSGYKDLDEKEVKEFLKIDDAIQTSKFGKLKDTDLLATEKRRDSRRRSQNQDFTLKDEASIKSQRLAQIEQQLLKETDDKLELQLSSKLLKLNYKLQDKNLTFVKDKRHKQYIEKVSKLYTKIYPIKFETLLIPHNLPNSSEQIPSLPFTVNLQEYFNMESSLKVLYYFQPFTKLLHIYDLEYLRTNINQIKPDFQTSGVKMTLKINFELSFENRSIITPEGDIYITGAKLRSSANQPDNSLHIVEFDKESLKQLARMNTPRKFHAICYLEDYIYVIGGKTQESPVTRSCEKYCISDDKWTNIAMLNEAISHSCVTIFNNQYIFKFGGLNRYNYPDKTIERYDPYQNVWWIVRYQSKTIGEDIELLYGSQAIQVNEKEIFIFGGRNINGYKWDSAFLYECGENENVTDQSRSKLFGTIRSLTKDDTMRVQLSFGGELQLDSLIVYKNSLYTLRKNYYG